MDQYRAILQCREPVANGFSCDTMDVYDFGYAGEMCTVEDTAKNIRKHNVKRCSKCFSNNWVVRGLTRLTNKMTSIATRT